MQPNLTLLEKLQYDALNRLVASTPSTQAPSQRFYLKDRLATEIQGTAQHSIMQHDDQLLAQQKRQNGAVVELALLATDQQRSVLTLLDAKRPHAFAYTPYGHCLAGGGLLSLLGFNGERPDPVTGGYLLGTGYHRPFNPVLMCFTSPDSWSPFGEGGLNAYAYCGDDPVNHEDRTGHAWRFFGIRLGSVRRPRHAAISIIENAANHNNPAFGSASSLDTRSLIVDLPPPSTKLDIQTVIDAANNSIFDAHTKNYSGRKLKALERHLKKLKKDFVQHKKLAHRVERRLTDEFNSNDRTNLDFYIDARVTVGEHLDRRAAKVKSNTETLNNRLRRS